MTIDGITMRVVGRRRTPMRRAATAPTRPTRPNTINIGAGESFDVIFTAPPFTGGRPASSGPGYDTYMLYNRTYVRSNNLAPAASAVRPPRSGCTRPAPTSHAQTVPNT